MSKIQEQLSRLPKNTKVSIDYIFENSTVYDIKEYIIHLLSENNKKDERIKDLIIENETLKVKLDIS